MSEPLAYAVDFGTSNSAIAVAYQDRVEVLPIDPSASPPQSLASIIYLERGGQRSAGEDAVRQYLATGSLSSKCVDCLLAPDCRTYKHGGFCMDSRLMSGLKSHLADGFRATHSWAVDFTMADRVAVILRTMKRRADQVVGHDVKRAVFGHPVAFEGTEGSQFTQLQERAEETLLEAARLAGFEEVSLYPEPSAAVIDETLDRGRSLAVDFGGGTFDVAVIEFSPDSAEVTALQGAAIGGERFDAMIFDNKVAERIGLKAHYLGKPFPSDIAERLRTIGGTARLLGDKDVAGRFLALRRSNKGERLLAVEAMLYGGQAYALHKAIERAKMELSESDSTVIRLDRPGIRLEIPITQAEFSRMIQADLLVVREAIEEAMARAGTSPEGIDLVIRTGGSSRIAAFRSMLEEMFGPAKVQERHLFNTVVAGLGTEARRLWAA